MNINGMIVKPLDLATFDDLEITGMTGHKFHGWWYISITQGNQVISGNGRTFEDALRATLTGDN